MTPPKEGAVRNDHARSSFGVGIAETFRGNEVT